jgi:hypothetical protein
MLLGAELDGADSVIKSSADRVLCLLCCCFCRPVMLLAAELDGQMR